MHGMNKTASLITHYQQSDFKDFVQIQKLFHERNIVLDYVVLDYIDIDSSIQKVKECAKKDNYLIGDIFTSFYLRYETNSNAKILINPIMKPSNLKYLEKVVKNELGVKHFVSYCDTENIASYKVMERLGMIKTEERSGRKNRCSINTSKEYRYELLI